ncbi:MFS transporter [Acetobacterium woodii]|uniref:Major facilitator superfamily MFS_1 transporter n=1 Tax=Acetobacterium woodii (strain ATCC 29683 / DSM 1030 / JCM 2381 / KCTC 1655 / WB1) TaxID=931626 RepID=H6LHL4_ACEWD|nr:MFS transporter [Acetobacterium woodii]AFA47193.1 major facilitator superfamily MFS_1 transporter [Acetobacterium woodii DSM 1030]
MKLDYRLTVLVGLGFMTISAFWSMYDFVIPLIMLKAFKFGDTMAGVVMSFDNILALFMLPLFGMLSDKTNTKMGRRMPYIIAGTAMAVISMLVIPYAVIENKLGLFIAALAIALLAMAFYRSPAVALMPDVTPKPLRSKGNAVINLMGAVGGILVLGMVALLAPNKDNVNYWPLFLVTAGIMVAGVVVLKLTVNEPEAVKKMRSDSAAMGIDVEEAENDDQTLVTHEKLSREYQKSLIFILLSVALWFMGYNAVTSAFSKYALVALDIKASQSAMILMVASIAAIISFIPVGIISSKVGRKKIILLSVVVLAIVFGTASFYTAFNPLLFVSFAVAGIAWAAINVNSLPMVLEMSKGANVGRYTGYYYTASMAAQVITPIISGALLEHLGYHTLMPYGTLFIGLAFLTMLMVKHGDSKPIAPKSKLEVFDALD